MHMSSIRCLVEKMLNYFSESEIRETSVYDQKINPNKIISEWKIEEHSGKNKLKLNRLLLTGNSGSEKIIFRTLINLVT